MFVLQLREERLRQGGFDGEDPPASVGSSRPSSGSRRSSVHQASPSGCKALEIQTGRNNKKWMPSQPVLKTQ